MWVARPWEIPSELRFPSAGVGSRSLFLPALWHGPAASRRDAIITQSNVNTTALTDHSAGFITATFTHWRHKSLPVGPPNTGSPLPVNLDLSHMLHIVFLISLPVFSPPHPSVCLPRAVGQRMILHVLPRSASMKRLCLSVLAWKREGRHLNAHYRAGVPPSVQITVNFLSPTSFFFLSSHLFLVLWHTFTQRLLRCITAFPTDKVQLQRKKKLRNTWWRIGDRRWEAKR